MDHGLSSHCPCDPLTLPRHQGCCCLPDLDAAAEQEQRFIAVDNCVILGLQEYFTCLVDDDVYRVPGHLDLLTFGLFEQSLLQRPTGIWVDGDCVGILHFIQRCLGSAPTLERDAGLVELSVMLLHQIIEHGSCHCVGAQLVVVGLADGKFMVCTGAADLEVVLQERTVKVFIPSGFLPS